MDTNPDTQTMASGLRRALRFVAIANLVYFGVEFAVALSIRSASLIADSIDFLEDASVNFLILAALNWAPRVRARIGLVLAALVVAPCLLSATAAAAIAWPTFRATSVDPMTLLREE